MTGIPASLRVPDTPTPGFRSYPSLASYYQAKGRPARRKAAGSRGLAGEWRLFAYVEDAQAAPR
jgi:hypothetical protein